MSVSKLKAVPQIHEYNHRDCVELFENFLKDLKENPEGFQTLCIIGVTSESQLEIFRAGEHSCPRIVGTLLQAASNRLIDSLFV